MNESVQTDAERLRFLLKEKWWRDTLRKSRYKRHKISIFTESQAEKIMIISERIFCVMEKNKITQAELSRRTGISVKNISDWKHKKTNPNAESLLPICNALDITPNQLLTGKGIEPDYNGVDTEYEVSNADIKILKQMHSLGDDQFNRLMAYMKALQKLEAMESIVGE